MPSKRAGLDVDESDRPISVEALAEHLQLSAQLRPLPRERLNLGADLARWLVILTTIVLAMIGVYAWQSYPSAAETRLLSPGCTSASRQPCSLVEVQQQRVSDWFDSVKDLVQLLVVSLLIPLLATLIGYLFSGHDVGRHASER
jgi:hypothetical protein